jgi:hypothetical protein
MKPIEQENSNITDQKRCHLWTITIDAKNPHSPLMQQLSYNFVKIKMMVQKMKTKIEWLMQRRLTHVLPKIDN